MPTAPHHLQEELVHRADFAGDIQPGPNTTWVTLANHRKPCHRMLLLTAALGPIVVLALAVLPGGTARARGASTPLPTPSESPSPPPPPPSIPVAVRSSVSIRYDSDTASFRGRVRSPRPRCERGRKVTLKKERAGTDRALAATTTNRRGRWRIARADPKGSFYARAARKRFTLANGTTIECRATRSRSISP